MLSREQKSVQIEALREKVERAQAIIAVDYRGLTVDETNELRSNFRKADESGQIEYTVAKNTLLKRAAGETPFEPLSEFLSGPTAIAITYDEPSVMAKVLVDFAKDNEKLELKGGAMDGVAIDVAAINALS
ncbi:MAG: 50S ribosomal protein L10, partial [bacterium]|nr:50S ribosomal protein L10 [bacterium]